MVGGFLDHRVRQLAPSFILLMPFIFKYDEYFIGEKDVNEWYVLSLLVLVLIVVSLITETIGELVEYGIWSYIKANPKCLYCDIEEITSKRLSEEWFKYLKRKPDDQVLADKYLGSLVERMLLRCSLVIPFFISGLSFSCIERDLTAKIFAAVISFFLCVLMLYAARKDQIEAIRIRKSIIKQESRSTSNLSAN